MEKSDFRGSLGKFVKLIEGLPRNKQISVCKWLEGVIVGQALSSEERENAVKAVNRFLRSLQEDRYEEGVNMLLEFLKEVQVRRDSEVAVAENGISA